MRRWLGSGTRDLTFCLKEGALLSLSGFPHTGHGPPWVDTLSCPLAHTQYRLSGRSSPGIRIGLTIFNSGGYQVWPSVAG
jgi:hypothetical protein